MDKHITTHVFCGEKGCGKSTYVIGKWPRHILLRCDSALNQLKTASVLEHALSHVYNHSFAEISEMVAALRSAVMEDRAVIVDCAECIDAEILKIIINTLIPIPSATLIFTFDIDVQALYKNKIFRMLIEWNLVSSEEAQHNFTAPSETFEAVIRKALPGASLNMLHEVMEISSLNFQQLNRLVWLIRNKQRSYEELSESVIAEYSYVMIEEKFSDLPRDMFEVLKKSSVIGEIFQRHVLEAQGGFHILGVKRYLEELEAMNLFIHSYLSTETYQFMSNQIHAGVLKCIEPQQRIAWEQLLLNYYLKRLRAFQTNNEELEYLLQVKRLSVSLNKHQTTYFANKKLLYRYIELQDTSKALGILDEIILYCKLHVDDSGLFHFLCFYKIRMTMKLGEFSEALNTIYLVQEHPVHADSLYLQYYQAFSLYGSGDVDQSYAATSNLLQKLERTSSNAFENQPIYAMAYSLMATLQHHFGIEDRGTRYYVLALNHSRNKLQDKTTYYEILKKCDMYLPYDSAKLRHMESIAFFEENDGRSDSAEVYMNRATEMMFYEKNTLNEALVFFQKALDIFENTPNWKLAYVKNNLAIYHIVYRDDITKAVALLESALLVDLSAFTYVTIYLNLVMCYLALYGLKNEQYYAARSNFNKYHKLISQRENATQYDDIYKQLVDLIVMEHSGHAHEANVQARSILAMGASQFFTPVLKDLIARTDGHVHEPPIYSRNANFYASINKHKMFLAEFRFWE